MRKLAILASVVFMCVVALVLIFRVIDASLEVDDLKSQIKLQQKSINFLQRVSNQALQTCSMSVAKFESIARENGHDVLWQGDSALVGPFRVGKKDACLRSMELVGL